jgi:eukaryotic-like serine/threonine-protein kinase
MREDQVKDQPKRLKLKMDSIHSGENFKRNNVSPGTGCKHDQDPIMQKNKGKITVGVTIVLALLLLFSIGGLCQGFSIITTLASKIFSTQTIQPSELPKTTEPTVEPTINALSEPEAGTIMISTMDGMPMVFVPSGEFSMGSPDDEGDGDEHPQHTVFLRSYWIDQTEVTNAMYEKCVTDGGCTPLIDDSSTLHDPYYGNPDFNDYPVIDVNWNQASAYCAWAGRVLPTEAQWEKAARGIQGWTYPWGNELTCDKGNFDDETQIDTFLALGRSDCDGFVETSPVGSFPAGASPYGALDMAGNVREWVADWYGRYLDNYSKNPVGPERGTYRVVRDGSWDGVRNFLRSAHRDLALPTYAGNEIGFRCALRYTPPSLRNY